MSVASEIQRLQAAKADIKTAIEEKGVTVPSTTKLDGYADLVDQIQQGGGDTDGLNGFLSVESKTIATSASATTNITYNKNCGILDENYKKWDTLAWHQRWVDNGYSATGLSKPIGIWMKAFGLDLTYLWVLTSPKRYSDATGTASIYNSFGMFPHSQDAITSATAADRTVWPANQSGNIAHGTAGKYKSATFRTVNNGNGLDMVCDNTLETFHIPSRDVGTAYMFMADNDEDRMESFYQQNEFCRALFAICSGISTIQPNGTKTTVDILNASGQQAAVNEDMYFWIGGTNTGLLAKYNLSCNPKTSANVTTGYLTQAIADAIYNKQKSNGVNMNDTGVNSDTKSILLPGMAGAEAIAVDGYWYIKTPFVNNPNGSSFEALRNLVNIPAVYFCRYKNFVIPSERKLYPYWLNKSTHITSLVSLLRTTEGLTDVPALIGSSYTVWSVVREGNLFCNQIAMDSGMLARSNPNTQFYIIPCLPSSTIFTT